MQRPPFMENIRKASRALAPMGLTILRVVVGFVMAFHGWTKLADYSGWRENVASLGVPMPEVAAALSLFAELGCGVLLMIGFLTPIAALFVAINMVVAIVTVHLGNGLLARDGGFEYPLVLAVIALFFVVRGGGKYSLDRLLFKRRRREPELRYGPYGRPITGRAVEAR